MIISDTLKLIFIHVHRTGGTTIENLLKIHLVNKIINRSQHENAKTTDYYLIDNYNDYYTFGFTRNPWERILSWYSLMHKNNPLSISEERKRLETFIESNAASDFNTQYFHYNSIDYFTNTEGELKVNKIFRYENFNNAAQEILNRFNLPLIEIPILNDTYKKDYHDFYTKRSQHLIEEKCRLDIDYFNYCF